MRDVNPETITGTLSWYEILPLNGFNLIRAKQNPHMRRKKVCPTSWDRRTDRMLYTQTTRWNLGDRVKIYHGKIVLQHLIDPETNGIAERAVRRVKEGTAAVLQQSRLDER